MSNLVKFDDIKHLASPMLVDTFEGIAETLESVESMEMPRVGFKDCFTLPDESEVQTLEGVILHVRKANAYFSGPYNPSEAVAPDCGSSDGIKPDQGESIQHTDCKTCPRNQFGSSKTGAGKACKNMKVVYLRLNNGLFPTSLTVPPTSIRAVDSYLMNLASQGTPMNAVLTKFELWKKDKHQTHKNISLTMVTSLENDALKDAKFLREYWHEHMKGKPNEQKTESKEVGSQEVGSKEEIPF